MNHKSKVRSRLITIGILVMILISGEIQAQSRHVRKREKELGQKAEEREAESEVARQEGLDRHLSIQSKSTIKRMKELEKKNKRLMKNKGEPFFKKWFIRKRKKASRKYRKQNG